jgi:DNA polymerase-3 subunit delta'
MDSPLDTIPGQNRVRTTLSNFLKSDSIPHAFLFTGLEGTGKDYAAKQFAKALLINENKKDSEKSLRFVESLQEPYVKLIFPLPRGKNETDSSSPTEKLSLEELETIREQVITKAENPFHKISIERANSIKINSIRDIKRFLSLQYDELSYRFIFIIDAHLMSDEAQNALLKSLEEPPAKVIFFIITSFVNKLKPTILSRCWKIGFNPLSDDDLVYILKKYFQIDERTAAETVPFAMGSVQTALHLINLDIHNLKEKTVSILRYSFGRKYDSAFKELNSILADNHSETYAIIISMIITWINDIQKYKLKIKRYFFSDHIATLEKFNSKFPDVDLCKLATQLDNLSKLPSYNINPALLSANLILELSSFVLSE